MSSLLSLVNERTKATLTYASIDEMIDSCASTVEREEPELTPKKRTTKKETYKINAFSEKMPPISMVSPCIDDYSYKTKMNMDAYKTKMNMDAYKTKMNMDAYKTKMNMDALLMATNSNMSQQMVPNPSTQSPSAIPGLGLPRSDSSKNRFEVFDNYRMENSLSLMLQYEVSQPEPIEPLVDVELVSVLTKVLEASQNKRIKLSTFAVDDLSANLTTIKRGAFLHRSPGSDM